MPEYLVSCRDRDGKKSTRNVEAESADAAVATLREQGFDDIVLHTDDVGARYTRQGELAQYVSPEDYVAFREKGGYLHLVLWTIRKTYARTWLATLIFLLLIGYRRTAGWPHGFFDWLLYAVLTLPIVYPLIAHLFSSSLKYDSLMQDFAWGRWESVLRKLPAIEKKLPPEEAAFRKATALAALGRLDEALDAAQPFGDGERMPEWQYLGRLAEVYLAVRDIDKAIELMEEALELAPDNPVVLLEVAGTRARYVRDLPRARSLLEEARTHALSDLLIPIANQVEGTILFEEGKAHAALEKLLEAKAGIEKFLAASPLIGIFVDICRGYLALAYAATGDRKSALASYEAAVPRLRALKIDTLKSRCEQALGLAG